jgi:hypothetical protein
VRGCKKAIGFQVLFNSAKEEFYLPRFVFDIGYLFGIEMKKIAQIDVALFCLRVQVAQPSEGDENAVGLGDLDAYRVVRGDPSGFLGLLLPNNPVFDTAFQASDEPDLLEGKLIEPAELDTGLWMIRMVSGSKRILQAATK